MQDEILIKYLLGEAEVEEVTLVEHWLENNSQNQQHLLNLRNIWDKSQQLAEGNNYNIEQQWQQLQAKMKVGQTSAKESISSQSPKGKLMSIEANRKNNNSYKRSNITFLKWAAAVAVLALGSWLIFHSAITKEGNMDNLEMTATASPVTDTLSDGTIITLNHYSRLLAPLTFSGKTREVTLKQGEAFFQVVHQEKQPFLVHSGKVDVTVLGTSFNIKIDGKTTVIHVATGKVKVDYKGQHLILQKDEQVFIDPGTSILRSQKTQSMLYNYYVTRQFIATNTRLEDLAKVLSEAYGVHITFGNNSLKDLRLTTVFVQQPIDKILDIIAATFNIQVVKNKDSYILQ